MTTWSWRRQPTSASWPAIRWQALPAEANAGLANCCSSKRNTPKPSRCSRAPWSAIPRDPGLNAQLATALLGQGKEDEALPVLETLRQLEPGNASVDQMLADAYSQAGHPEKADPIYARHGPGPPRQRGDLAGQGENLLRERLYPQAQLVLRASGEAETRRWRRLERPGLRGIGK